MRMFGPKGNSQASNLFAVIHYLQEQEVKSPECGPGGCRVAVYNRQFLRAF